MPTIGLDCELILDGSGYFVEPGSFVVARPRVYREDYNRTPSSGAYGTGTRYVDMGPGKREWQFIVPCFQAMRNFAGQPVGVTGQTYRDALHTSYARRGTTLSFTDPSTTVWSVHFNDLVEEIADVRAVADGQLQYYLHISLGEA